MSEKIQLKDLISNNECNKYGIKSLPISNTRESIYEVIKEDIKNSFLKHKSVKARSSVNSFYNNVPLTKLEISIDRALKIKEIDIVEKRKENYALFDFEKKMQRFNKIKSKKFRKMRRIEKMKNTYQDNIQENTNFSRRNKCIEDSSDSESSSEDHENGEDLKNRSNPIMEFHGKDEVEDFKESLEPLEIKDQEDEFLKEKSELIKSEMPQIKEIVLPGWGLWGGIGCQTKKTKTNVIIEKTEGIPAKNRKDKGIDNVIINEKQPVSDKKYKINIPRGYTKQSYEKKINLPISKEWSSLRIFNKFVKPKNQENSEVLEQFHFDPRYEI